MLRLKRNRDLLKCGCVWKETETEQSVMDIHPGNTYRISVSVNSSGGMNANPGWGLQMICNSIPMLQDQGVVAATSAKI
ncbi:hypothetical protein Y032_0123g1140 [Ancylostoma ceylanicum]|nr:hypothetical protein Y032_0123g1140 [Ancylostoma ceylanicum]